MIRHDLELEIIFKFEIMIISGEERILRKIKRGAIFLALLTEARSQF